MSSSRTILPVSGVPLLVAAGVLWGTGGLLGTLFADSAGLSPAAVAGYRLFTGGVLLLVPLLLTRARLPRGAAAWRRIAIMAVLAAQFQVCYFAAVAATSVSLATLVTIGTAPVLVLLAEWVRGTAPTPRVLLGCALALVGLGLLVGLPAPGAGSVALGVGFATLSAAGFAAMTMLGTRPVPGLDAATTTGVGFTIGGAALLLVAAPWVGIGFAPTPAAVGLLVVFALVPTAAAYACYFRGLRTAPAAVGAVVSLLEPLTAAVLAAVLLGDRLGPTGVAGAVLLGTAVLLTSLPTAVAAGARRRGRFGTCLRRRRAWFGGARQARVRRS